MQSRTFERIVVPTDLTIFTDAAMGHAALFHRSLGSSITLMHANEVSWFTAEHPIGYYIDNVPERKDDLRKRLSEFAARYAAYDGSMTTRFVDDEPARAIIKTADEVDADLIIMGTHARRGVTRAILGSVTERVLRDTKRPVLTVRPGATPAPQLRSVLCPVNFTDIARQALEAAAAIARAFDARLIVMHVIEGEPPVFSHVTDEFARWVDPLVRDQTMYQQIVVHGDAVTRITETAEIIGSSLLVIGAQHKLLGDTTVIGGSTASIVRSATRPVLTVIGTPAAEKREAA